MHEKMLSGNSYHPRALSDGPAKQSPLDQRPHEKSDERRRDPLPDLGHLGPELHDGHAHCDVNQKEGEFEGLIRERQPPALLDGALDEEVFFRAVLERGQLRHENDDGKA